MRVYYNPYRFSEIWVTSFGNGIKVGDNSGPHGISSPNVSFQRIEIFPNPCEDILTINNEDYIPGNFYTYYIYDLSGTEVGKGMLNRITTLNLNAIGIKQGCYFLKIMDHFQVISYRKILKL
jgi:hypothetical protein